MHYTADVLEGCESYLIITLDAEPISDSPFMLRVFCAEFAANSVSVQKLPHATANNLLNEPHTIRARVSIAFLSSFLSIASDAFSLSNRPSRRCLCCSCLESVNVAFCDGLQLREPLAFSIHSVGSGGNALPRPTRVANDKCASDATMTVKCPSGKRVSKTMARNAAKMLQVEFVPLEYGAHEIWVHVGKDQVAGSPFQVVVH